MRQLLLLLVCLLGVFAQKPACTSSQFNYCNSNLANSVGLPGQGQQMFKNWTIMYNQFLYMFGQNPGSTQSILQVCNALEIFNDCLVGSNNKGCTDIQNLVQNTDLQSAWFIVGTLSMYQFNCGPGVNTLIHTDLTCAQRVLQNYQNTLQACVTSYQSRITLDNKNACGYVNDLIKCWSTPFYTAPCRRAQAADVWWSCEANNQFTNPQYPNCGIDCDALAGPFITGNSWIQDHHKVVEGEHWYKITSSLVMREGKIVEEEGPWMNN